MLPFFYLTSGEGLDIPQELWDILNGHLQVECISPEAQCFRFLEQLPTSSCFCSNRRLQSERESTWSMMQDRTRTAGRQGINGRASNKQGCDLTGVNDTFIHQ